MSHNEGMRIGEYNVMFANRDTPQGFYLDDGEDEVLLPRNQVPLATRNGDEFNVFVYTDSEDRPVATLKKPYAVVGEFARLTVISTTGAGAFFDWGLDKDLFCPLKEQADSLVTGQKELVRVYLDPVSERVACSTRINRFLQQNGVGLEQGQAVKIQIAGGTWEQIQVIINGHIKGALFPDEWFDDLQVGDKRDGFIKSIRPDDFKVAVSFRPQGYEAVLGETDALLELLRANGGSLPVSDRTSPEEIHRRFGISKGAFKKLIGTLYREGVIDIDYDRIVLRRR